MSRMVLTLLRTGVAALFSGMATLPSWTCTGLLQHRSTEESPGHPLDKLSWKQCSLAIGASSSYSGASCRGDHGAVAAGWEARGDDVSTHFSPSLTPPKSCHMRAKTFQAVTSTCRWLQHPGQCWGTTTCSGTGSLHPQPPAGMQH